MRERVRERETERQRERDLERAAYSHWCSFAPSDAEERQNVSMGEFYSGLPQS